MAVNDVQEQTLSNRIESLPPKIKSIKSHPYLNAYSTPPLPKPLHFHQLSDQTGQSANHHHHQLSTISLPTQQNNSFDFKPIVFNQQIDKQPIYLNGNQQNIEKYEIASYNDKDRKNELCNQQIYINHPINRSPKDNLQLNNQANGHLNGQANCQFNNLENHHRTHHLIENQNLIQSTYHGLPLKFVKALKKLFDIFDTNKTGLVRVIDIETRINEEDFDEDLDRPQDLIDSLNQLKSPNGLINFPNFCSAINICLLKNQLAKTKQQADKSAIKNDRNDSYLKAQRLDKSISNGFNNGHHPTNGVNGINQHLLTNGNNHRYNKQSSVSNSPLDNSSFASTNSASSSSNSSSRLHKDLVKLNLKSNQNNQTLSKQFKYRPSSVPVEFNDDEADYYETKINQPSSSINKKLDNKAKSMGNLKEQIYANKLRLCSSESRIQQNTAISREIIMEKLKEWRKNLLERKLRSMNMISNNNQLQFNQPNPQLNHLYSIVNKKTVNNRKKDEMRRHTVNIVQSNLHSLNTANKLTNMQKERDLLQQGLLIIDRAKQFYIRQIAIVKNQIDTLNQYASGSNFFVNQLNNDYNLHQHLDKLASLEQMNRNFLLLIDDQLSQTNRLIQPEEIHKQNLIIHNLRKEIQLLNDEKKLLSDELIRKSNLIVNLEQTNPFLKIHH